MDFIREIKSHKSSVMILGLIIVMVLTTTLISSAVTVYGLTTDYYRVKMGDKVIATLESEADAKDMIETVKNYYVQDGDVVTSVTIDPALTVEKFTVKGTEQPKLTADPQAVIHQLIVGDSKDTVYTVADGDTLWTIAYEKLGTDLDTLLSFNPGLSIDSNLLPGDELIFKTIASDLNVIVDKTVTSKKAIPYETAYEDSEDLYVDEEEVKTEGVNGSRDVVESVRACNGVETGRTEISSTQTLAPVTKVILKGTKERPAPAAPVAETTGSGRSSYSYGTTSYSVSTPSYTGGAVQSAIVNEALRELGWRQQCTDLVSHALAAAGIYHSGGSYSYASLGSFTSNPVPGDIAYYGSHVAVYIGNNQAVHGGFRGGNTEIFSIYNIGPELLGFIHIG